MLAKNYSDATISKLEAARHINSVDDIEDWARFLLSAVPGRLGSDEWTYTEMPEDEREAWQTKQTMLRGYLQQALHLFDPYFVAEDTARLIVQGAMVLPADTTVSLDMVPTRLGWLHLENAQAIWRDMDPGNEYPHSANVAWSVDHKTGSLLCFFFEERHPAKFAISMVVKDGDEVSLFDLNPDQMAHPTTGQLPIAWGIWLRILVSAWSFVRQRIVMERQETPNRTARTMEERAKAKPQQVRIIQLRAVQRDYKLERQANETEAEHHKRMSRWMVGGHWRNQAIGPGWSEHRKIWIMPYQAGNPEAPLRNVEKIFAMVR